MLIDITKIKTENRIRKDFGNIQELADDIKQNGLINPPVVIAETDGTFTLLAGERRLRAMKSLGYRQVEVRTWGSLTDEQKLNIEISENEVRKDFSKAERIEYARRLEKIESVKARERQATSTGGVNPQLSLKSDEAGRTDEIVAERLGIGGKDTYRKEKYIVDNADTLTPKDFTDWDEGKLSTNKAYLKIKEQLAKKENQIAGYEAKMKRVDELKAKIQSLETELANRPTETIEVKPADYDDLVKLNRERAKDNQQLRAELDAKHKELSALKEQIRIEKEQSMQKQVENKIIDDAIFFCAKVDAFIKDVGGLAYLSDKIEQLPTSEEKAYIKAVTLVKAWAENILKNID
nr:MAG TPA: chromosome partitioning protein [Caudoviricetes sp.]